MTSASAKSVGPSVGGASRLAALFWALFCGLIFFALCSQIYC
jgi:hypothetical protein